MQDTCDSSKILVTIFLDNLYQEQLLQLAHRGGEGRVLCVLTQRLKMNMRFLSRSNPAARPVSRTLHTFVSIQIQG